jgi:RecB family exonuclease
MKTVSYSQFSLYQQCPKRWKLDYLDNLRKFDQNINTTFGSAFHTTIQNYLQVMYEESVKKADEIDLGKYLQECMMTEYKNALLKNNNTHYTTAEQLSEYCQDGIAIFQYFKRHRSAYFSSKQHTLLGIETPLNIPLRDGIRFTGFIDIVIRDERDGRIKIYDFKTSTAGWNKYQKADKSKTAQMILYKEFYAQQFNVDVETIDIEYIIVRRKINEELEFVPKRIQTFVPANGKVTRNKILKMFNNFLDSCFTESGEYNQQGTYPAHTTSACNYCPYLKEDALCPKKERIKLKDEAGSN